MDKFDKYVKEEIQGYLNKHVHFSRGESEQIRRKTTNKSSTKKFHGVYYTVLASTVVLFTILSLPFFKTWNFNHNSLSTYFAAEEQEIKENGHIKASLDNLVNETSIKRSREMLSNDVTNELQQSLISNPEKYKLQKASFNYWSSGDYKDSYPSNEITLALSFQDQQNSYFTQIFEGEINLEDQFEIIEKARNWKLIPEKQEYNSENNYVIAVLDLLVNHKNYTIIVQTYDIHDDFYANPYSKTEILDFIDSLQPELAVKKLLAVNTED